MSVLRKKMTAQPVASDLNETDIATVWKEVTGGCLNLLEELTDGLHWAEDSFSTQRVERSGFGDTLPKTGLYAGFGPTEKEISCLCLASASLAGILGKCGIDGEISNFSGIEDYAVSDLDLFMMDPFVSFVKDSLGGMMMPSDTKADPGDSEVNEAGLGKFQKEEIDLSSFILSEKHKSWFKISLGFKAKLEEGDDTQSVSFQIVLPLSHLKATLANSEIVQEAEPDFLLPENAKYLGRHIDKSVTSVRAVLDSLQMSVADCTRLEIGQVLPLPGVSLENISLEVEMRDQRLAVANGLLGIHKTRRAVKLSEEVSQEFRGDVIC